ncbi:MAG: methyltransferase domain-containing protein [Nitrospinota bacterium]|mgnify:CR=1 FL=1
MPGFLHNLIESQKKLSRWLDSPLPEKFRIDGNTHFQQVIAPRHLRPEAVVYDIGGGKTPLVTPEEKVRLGLRVIGLDIDADELGKAPPGSYDEMICADIAQFRGRGDGDFVICRTVLEHVTDVPAAFEGIVSMLKRGGLALIFVPSRNAVYARLNLMLPQSFKRRMLRFLFPELGERIGFPSYYQRCTIPDFVKMAGEAGLDLLEKRAYYLSEYFSFFAPAHLLWRAWIMLFYLLREERAAETFSLVLEKNRD